MFSAFVGVAHRAVQVEDQLVRGAALVNAINPLPRHVHQELQVLARRQNLRLEPIHLSAGRQASLVNAPCRRSRGVLYGQKPEVPLVMRISLVAVKPHEDQQVPP